MGQIHSRQGRSSRALPVRGPAFPALLALLALLALTTAAPLLAYKIVLKDGSSMMAKEKYRIAGRRALITLPNGIQTFLEASQIDVAKTEEANRSDYGTAVVIEGSQVKPAGPAAPAPPERTLADLIERRQGSSRELASTRREARRDARQDAAALGRTKAGYVDLQTLPRRPFAQLDAAAELQQFFRSKGIEEVEVYQGSAPDRPLLEVVASSEAGVFRALAVAANALLRVRDAHPRVGSLELLMATPAKERAGQFVITPQNAADLVAKNVEVSSFFLDNVQF